MIRIEFLTLEAPDPEAAQAFYTAAFGLGDLVRVRAIDAPSSGFRGYTVSLVVPSRAPSKASSAPP